MSHAHDYSYCHSSGEDSFSYVLDSSYCPVHCCPSSIGYVNYYPPYSYYDPPVLPQPSASSGTCSTAGAQTRPDKARRFSSEQIRILEEHFYRVDKYVSREAIDDLSARTHLTPAQIRIWFNNKRSRARH